MKKINVLIASSFFRTFVPIFFIVMFILLIQFVWVYVDDLVGKGLEWSVIGKLLFYWSASLIPQAMPLAVLLASIMTFGNLGETYELVAIKASGVSIWKMFRPMLFIMFLVALFGFFVSNFLIPEANLKSRSLLHDVREKKPAIAITEGVFYSGIDGITMRVGKKDKETQELQDIIIYDQRDKNSFATVIAAKRGTMTMSVDNKLLFFNLYDGSRYEEMETQKGYFNTHPHSATFFSREEIMFDLDNLNFKRTDEDLFKQNFEMLNIFQLNYFSDSISKAQIYKSNELKNILKPNCYFLKMDLDSIIPKTNNYKISSLDKNILNHFAYQRGGILSAAENTARNSKNMISYAANESYDIVRNKARYNIEWHRKFILSIACIVMFFIGAPLGSIIRKGGFGLPVVVSVLMFLTYHIISLSGEKAAKTMALTPMSGMWLGIFVLAPLGLFLTIQASNDSKLFDKSSWKFLIKPFRLKNKIS